MIYNLSAATSHGDSQDAACNPAATASTPSERGRATMEAVHMSVEDVDVDAGY